MESGSLDVMGSGSVDTGDAVGQALHWGREIESMTVADEGVIKFRMEHSERALAPSRYGELACKLIAWREIMALTGLVGQDPQRYEGAGYGNVSGRIGAPAAPLGRRSFLITGTQTSGQRCIGLESFAVVESYDDRRNRVVSHGSREPSSESMTHGAVYDLGPHIRCVLHAHSPILWKARRALGLPTTDRRAAYGTPLMAQEVRRLYRTSALAERRILAMGGHEDGIVVFGRSPEEAGSTLITWLARAHETSCAAADVLLCGS
jgi:ribulose-5-phosphate 4-epimerase/fuculose-1-phosphate aldolase